MRGNAVTDTQGLETHVGAVGGVVLLTLGWPGDDVPSLVSPYTPDAAAAVARELLRAAREASPAPHLGPEPP
jgi:hypothetical protein